jgi:hypothetical protein
MVTDSSHPAMTSSKSDMPYMPSGSVAVPDQFKLGTVEAAAADEPLAQRVRAYRWQGARKSAFL